MEPMAKDEAASFLHGLTTMGVRGSVRFNVATGVKVEDILHEMDWPNHWKFVTSPISDGIAVHLKWEPAT